MGCYTRGTHAALTELVGPGVLILGGQGEEGHALGAVQREEEGAVGAGVEPRPHARGGGELHEAEARVAALQRRGGALPERLEALLHGLDLLWSIWGGGHWGGSGAAWRGAC
jgi:hypothetical protein